MVESAVLTPAAAELVVLELDSPEWREFVTGRPEATVFHHPAWARLLAGCYGYRPLVLGVRRGARLAAGMPLLEVRRRPRRPRLISLPFTDVCDPLAAGKDAAQELAARAVEWAAERGLPLEVRGEMPRVPGLENRSEALHHVLPLPDDAGRLLPGFAPSLRRKLRRADENEVEIVFGVTRRSLDDFYGLHLQTRRRLGVPVQPRRFIVALWRWFDEHGLGFPVIAYFAGRPVAAAVFLAWNRVLIYKYAASDPAASRLHPMQKLLWAVLDRACRARCARFDFGRTDFAAEGLRFFKTSWGAAEHELVVARAGGQARRPEGALAAAAATVIRSSPAVVCRMTGELLYPYFP